MRHDAIVLDEQFNKALRLIKDENIRKFTYYALTEYAPLSFWEIPAAFAANCHNESEKAIGEVQNNTVIKIGGKAWHTLRVVNNTFAILDADDEIIWDFMRKNPKGEFKGCSLPNIYVDVAISAALLHDIYSLCEGLDWKERKHRGMDKEHPYYHRTDLKPLADKYLPSDLWEFLLIVIESHMWKWSPHPERIPRLDNILNMPSVDSAYDFIKMYNVIKAVQLADLLAAQKDFTGF